MFQDCTKKSQQILVLKEELSEKFYPNRHRLLLKNDQNLQGNDPDHGIVIHPKDRVLDHR